MWEKIRVVFTIPELRQKILLTLFFLAVYRVGYQIPLPIMNPARLAAAEETDAGGNLFGDLIERVAVFSASDLRQATIFGLGIMPYISASIIFQLLGTVWKPIEDLQKEGESGRKKINEYTRYLTVFLCLIQSAMYVVFLARGDGSPNSSQIDPNFASIWWMITAVMIMTAGTVFLMWLGEQIDEFGIGNGISLLIMAGILARMPLAGIDLLKNTTWELSGFQQGKIGIDSIIVLVVLFVAVIAAVVFITLGRREIPTQSAKHVRGRRVYGGNKQYLPLRINQAGVMPIIFASSLLMFPQLGFTWLAQRSEFFVPLADTFNRGTSFIYNLLYVVLIFFFSYFWTAIQFNPTKMADDLKNFGTFIPGYRPGKRTADYLEKVMIRITYVGAAFLAVIAIIPTVVASSLGVNYQIASFYGGTGLLIAVSVAFDLVQKIDNHLLMRNYRGLLEA